jgi:hypothetical protein
MLGRTLLVLSLAATAAQAAPEPEPDHETDWSSAPRPDEASGVARPEATPTNERLLWIPRAIFYVPRWVFWGVAQPVRGGAYLYERYDVSGLFTRLFFNDAQTFGVYPIARYETEYGFTAGARLIDRNLFGRHERVKLRADFGGRYRLAYGAKLSTGERIPRAALEADLSYERRPDEAFYGIGNDADDEMRFQEDVVRNVVSADIPLVRGLSLRLSDAIMFRDLMGGEVDNTRVEAQLIYDSRRPTSLYATQTLDATGWYASVYGGGTRGVGGDPSEFYSYGGEVQLYFDLFRGTRVLALRVLVESIGGEGFISPIDLPQLGGTEFLRGYPRGRFRDRALTLATAEYTWDLGNYLAAYSFVDVGRVWHSLRDVDLEDPRVGYGVGLEFHTRKSFVGRGQLAMSGAGDFVLELVFSPTFPRRERTGRY